MANKAAVKSKKAKTAKSAARQAAKSKKCKAVATKPQQDEPSLPRRYRFIRPKGVLFPQLPNVITLSKTSIEVLWQHRRLFLGIALVDGLVNLILVQGLVTSLNISTLESNLSNAGAKHSSAISTSINAFAQLIGSGGGGSSSSTGAYEVFLAVITSLAVIWSLRQIYSAKKITVRDAYYRSMYPLIPFILILVLIIIELIPAIIGATIYSLVVSNGIAVGTIEKFAWFIVFMISAAISFYLICSTLFALYIVTLPDMTPFKAMRSARGLVRYRRLVLLRKLLWLPFALLIVGAVIMLPVILWLTPLTQWVFFILSLLALVVANSYVYNLYRDLLNE